MIIPAAKIVDRARKFIRLRHGEAMSDGVDCTFLLARICDKFGKRLYRRGHYVAEWFYR